MKLLELTRPSDKSMANGVLYQAGYKRIGDGLYARVWQKPGSKYVLKLFRSEDQCYLNYIRMVAKHPDNPHFPKIIGKPMKVNDSYYAVRLEPLNWGYTKLPDELRQFIAKYLTYRPGMSERSLLARTSPEIVKKWPHLVQACELILSVRRGDDPKECGPDIHSENILIRQDGTPVFSDPLS